ncbi:MAG: tRNA (N(6)-L-threonylcarbamoyladenosine(37)-C(2))-methylthiotransferase [Candidatus Thorarchaeota archaeon]|nr:tRNA (N(6)-L-threonylcarbamoyladenosine(37)-C(2))-methylthiotransferase [Candidatus Thorarchaeota archaeon]
MSMDFYLETYGCSLNKADSDLMVGRLNAIGLHRTETLNEASLILVNTCGVKEPTEDRIIHRLRTLAEIDIPVIIAGCLPCISLQRIESAIPSYAAILGPQSVDSLGKIAEQVLDGKRGILHLDSDPASKLRFFEGPPNSVICTIPICEGCLGHCSYCAVRFARGAVRSYSIDEIYEIVERCTHLGYREVRLTSQDAGVFGHDTGENLHELLQSLSRIPGKHRFRLGMFNPNLVIDSIGNLLSAMKSDHFFKFFHIPLQTGSSELLKKMGRQYTVEQWTEIVHKTRTIFPRATIATDIIVGFPGETAFDFRMTEELLRRIKPDVVNISKYGDRPGTEASKSTEKIDSKLKKSRSRELSRMVSKMIQETNATWTGWKGHAIAIEKGPKGGVVCRNFAYKSIILEDPIPLGTELDVCIDSAERTHLVAHRCLD